MFTKKIFPNSLYPLRLIKTIDVFSYAARCFGQKKCLVFPHTTLLKVSISAYLYNIVSNNILLWIFFHENCFYHSMSMCSSMWIIRCVIFVFLVYGIYKIKLTKYKTLNLIKYVCYNADINTSICIFIIWKRH